MNENEIYPRLPGPKDYHIPKQYKEHLDNLVNKTPNKFELTYRNKIISHRGNVDGPRPAIENSPAAIINAMNEGFDVEVDVWFMDYQFYLGHDEPQYAVNVNFLENKHIWCHAKNIDAAIELSKNPNVIVFGHDSDKYVITSHGIIWTSQHELITQNENTVFMITDEFLKSIVIGSRNPSLLIISSIMKRQNNKICTDYPLLFNKLFTGASHMENWEITNSGRITEFSQKNKISTKTLF